ncbi:MAG: hypothetical protein PHF00_13350 [Elusimicrobia bacterium]|nr:hypothetical protein [Elusimicrobiota bacterium]
MTAVLLLFAAGAGAEDFDQTISRELGKLRPRAGTVLGSVRGTRPPQASASALNFDFDVPARVKGLVLADLDFARGIEGSGASSYHGQVFGPVQGGAYLGFFLTRISRISFEKETDDFSTVAFVRDGPRMWLTSNYDRFKDRMPQIDRVVTLLHEARHAEPRGWPHVNCPDPFLDEQGKEARGILSGVRMAGEDACDDVPLGAYGIEWVWLKNIRQYCSNCTGKVKGDAALYAADAVKRIIAPPARKSLLLDCPWP